MQLTKELLQEIKNYKDGQQKAFETIYEMTKKELYAYVTYVMRGNAGLETICEDILQETYISISKHLSQLEKEESFPAWSKKIAKSECMAYVKKNKKYLLLKEEDNTFDMLEDSDDIIPEEIVQSQEKQRLIREILETQLTEIQRICIYDFYYNNKKQSEIAADLEIPENTVKTHLSRAKMRIKEGVIDLEKKQDTKLYSVAPIFMLLFKEDVEAAQVPESITRNVLSAVRAERGVSSATGGNIAKVENEVLSTVKTQAGIAKVGVTTGKAAIFSLKAKIAVAVIGLLTVGVVGTAVLTNLNKEEETGKRSKKQSDKKIEWNIWQEDDEEQENDDEQGVTDESQEQMEVVENDFASEEQYKFYASILAVLEEFTDLSELQEDSVFDVSELPLLAKMNIAAGLYRENKNNQSDHEVAVEVLGEYWRECTGETFTRSDIDNRFSSKMQDPEQNRWYHGHKYQEGMVNLEYYQWSVWKDGVDFVDTYYPCNINQEIRYEDGIYKVVDGKSGKLLKTFEGIEEQDEYFIVSGRLDAYGNMPFEIYFYKNEDSQRGYILDSIKYFSSQAERNEANSEIKLPDGIEITESELEAIEVLARFINTKHWADEDVNDVTEEINIDLALWVTADLSGYNAYKGENRYDKYLPPKAGNTNGGRYDYKKADLQKYVKDVFGVEMTGPDNRWFYEEGDLYYAYGTQYSNTDKAIIDEIEVQNGQYIVKGSIVYGEYYDMNSSEPTYYNADRFTLYLVKNADSPFGFTVSKLYYEDTRPTEFVGTEYQYRVLLQMKQAVDDACISHWQMTEDFEIKVSDMKILNKLNFATSGYRYGWWLGQQERVSIEDLSKYMYRFTGNEISREEVDAKYAELSNGSSIYRGVKYREGMIDLYVEEEIMPNPWEGNIVTEYPITKEEAGTYQGGSYRYGNGNGTPDIMIKKVEEHGDRIWVYGMDYNTYNMPFVMKLKRTKYNPLGYILESIYYSAGQSDLADTWRYY